MGPEDADTSLVTRAGTVVAGGVLAALAASLPPVMRMGEGADAGRALVNWFGLAALLVPLSILSVAVMRRGRAGLRLLVGDGLALFAAALLWWAVFELGVLSVLGAILRAKTHHHGLAGVTFAMIAVGSALAVGLVAFRGARLLGRYDPKVHRVALVLAACAAFVELVLIGVRTSHSDALRTTAFLVDVFALLLACGMASARALARLKPMALAGVPVAALVLVAGGAALYSEPELRAGLSRGAPLHALVLGAFSSERAEPR